VLVQKILHKKMFIGNDTISEFVHDLDSDGGNFSDLSDSDMCKLHSPSSTAVVKAMNRKLSTQNLTQAGREHAGPLLNGQIQILS
jgi:hypothetical protein